MYSGNYSNELKNSASDFSYVHNYGPDPQQDEHEIKGPEYSRYRHHPGWGERSKKPVDRSTVKAARKANRKRKGRRC